MARLPRRRGAVLIRASREAPLGSFFRRSTNQAYGALSRHASRRLTGTRSPSPLVTSHLPTLSGAFRMDPSGCAHWRGQLHSYSLLGGVRLPRVRQRNQPKAPLLPHAARFALWRIFSLQKAVDRSFRITAEVGIKQDRIQRRRPSSARVFRPGCLGKNMLILRHGKPTTPPLAIGL